MAEALTLDQIHDEVIALREEVAAIKLGRIDPDLIMTPEDEERIAQARMELREGKAKSFEEVKAKLGL